MNTTREFEIMVEEFFADPETVPVLQKTRSRMRAIAGARKEKLKIKNLSENGANIEIVAKSPSKSYSKLAVPKYNDNKETKVEIKRECNRGVRRTRGDIADGAAYKFGRRGNEECENLAEVLYAGAE